MDRSNSTAAWVKYQLACKGLTLKDLARKHGQVSRQRPSNALYHPSPYWERIIAEELDTQPEVIWPERYGGA